ncbi:PleD family two-component system response regulator [Mucilaginibacter calamicampi]|uniref:PleD family two-component system response regulator n=1 Tax=Mucilaginibacter calamicampi TaxID=1302352 RepID=A0ABW2Z562_9SPHI
MKKGTILLIDDDPDILSGITIILQEAGYVVRQGHDVTAVFEIEKDPPDLLLIDNWLEGKTGRDICYQLKTGPKTQHIPVILISATRNLAETAASCLADDYIDKPFEIEELLSKVELIMNN